MARHVWLMQPPHPRVNRGVWAVVCVAAVAAMTSGLGYMRARAGPRIDRALVLSKAKATAATDFYHCLQVVASATDTPTQWGPLTPDHPFFWEVQGQGGSRGLGVLTPPDPEHELPGGSGEGGAGG